MCVVPPVAELVYDKPNEMCVVPPVAELVLKIFSPNKSSGAADFDCLLTMNDNHNEIDHCSVRMMMVIKKL